MALKSGAKTATIHFGAAFGLGMAAACGCGAALAALMASRGLGQPVVWSFATASVSAGSLLSGWLMALWQKRQGLFWGAAQGLAFVLALLSLQAISGNLPTSDQLARLALAVGFGAAGGYLGLLRAARRRRRS